MQIITDGMTPQEMAEIIEAMTGELNRCYQRIDELEKRVDTQHRQLIGFRPWPPNPAWRRVWLAGMPIDWWGN